MRCSCCIPCTVSGFVPLLLVLLPPTVHQESRIAMVKVQMPLQLSFKQGCCITCMPTGTWPLLMLCRLQDTVLRWMPVTHNKSLDAGTVPAEGDSPIKAVLRSKGFMWLSNKHTTAFYWSHAGQHFEIREEGDW